MNESPQDPDATKPSDSLEVTLVFKVGGKEQSYTHKVSLAKRPSETGIPLMTTQTFAEVEKEIRFSAFYDELPDPSVLSKHAPRSFTLEEQISGEYSFYLNTQEVWHEITNNLLSAKYLLSQSRAYKDVELLVISEGADHRSPEVLNIHLSKMNAFDGAVYRLAKIEDLFLLLLFVNFGNSLVETNMDSEEWQKKVSWSAVRDGMRKRHPEVVSNRYLNQTSDEDYEKIISVFRKFKNPAEVGHITAYRDATTHRIPPSVDYTGFNAALVFPKINELSHKVQTGGLAVRSYRIDYQFPALYEKAAKVFTHYVQVLKELKEVPRFS